MRLVLGLLISVGCGRLGFGSSDSTDAPTAIDSAPLGVATMIPGLSVLPPGQLDLGATATPTGFSLAFASVGGSDMFGLNLSPELVPDADWRSTSTGNQYNGTTMTWTGSLLTSMTAIGPVTWVKRYAANLASYTQMDSQACIGAKPTYARVGARWFYVMPSTGGPVVREMMSDGTVIGSSYVMADATPTGAPISGAIATDGTYVYGMWSHRNDQCVFGFFDPGPPASASAPVSGPCRRPRVAALDSGGVAVFERGNNVYTSQYVVGVGQSAPALLAIGTQPRLVRDQAGEYWFARIEATQIVVERGASLAQRTPVSLMGMPPLPQAFELVESPDGMLLFAIVNQQLWYARLGS